MMAERTTQALAPARHDTQDVGARFLAILLAGIGCTLLALIGLAYLMFPRQVHDRRFTQPFPEFPAPRLQRDPPGDWQAFHGAELRRLNGAGWVDRARGVVHIPIEQAMRDVAAEGIQGWPQQPGPGAARR